MPYQVKDPVQKRRKEMGRMALYQGTYRVELALKRLLKKATPNEAGRIARDLVFLGTMPRVHVRR